MYAPWGMAAPQFLYSKTAYEDVYEDRKNLSIYRRVGFPMSVVSGKFIINERKTND